MSFFATIGVILPQEGDLSVGEVDDAVVGDGDAVGVVTEIVEDLLGTAEGRLGVDDPIFLVETVLE